MTTVPSAISWGSLTATKNALLIHGLTSSSHTWHRVASSLAAQGYLVTAPNLIGHGSRVATDYSLISIAEDLRPYIAARHYSVVIGHSLGALTAIALYSRLPPELCQTALVLVDPPLHLTPEKIQIFDTIFSDVCTNFKPAEAYKAENPLWTGEDSTSRELGTRLCSPEVVHTVFEHNTPWNFFDHLEATSKKTKVTVLIADPALCDICAVEDIRTYPYARPVVIPGASHWIQHEFPEVIVDEALKTVAELERA